MTAQFDWPLLYFDSAGDAVDVNTEVQVSYRFINITDELLKASSEALNAWAMAVRADDSGVLKAPLANVCNLMVDVSLGRFMVF